MKLKHLAIILSACIVITACTKERVVERVVSGIHLLNFTSEPQLNNRTKVTITWADDDTTSTSYHVELFDRDSSTTVSSVNTTVKQIIYQNIRYDNEYGHSIHSLPGNDSLKIIFNIGTMGDVDIRTE
jgi:hypothetical protein